MSALAAEPTVKAIETRYAGHRFRSRLEARVAVLFDALQVPWEYEVEGFHLGELGEFLCDFWLPAHRLWVEVKPHMCERSLDKLRALAAATDCRAGALVWGMKPVGSAWALPAPVSPGNVTLASGPAKPLVQTPLHYIADSNGLKLVKAVIAARGARFEHGEKPE